MNLIWYLMVWSVFLCVGLAVTKTQENRRLRARLKRQERALPNLKEAYLCTAQPSSPLPSVRSL